MPDPDSGVYVMANDQVIGWLRPFAASLRHFNPEVRVLVIPYDGRLRQTRRLCRAHGFELWESADLGMIDRLGIPSRNPSLPPQRLRKLVALWGPLERFLLLDADVLVLMELAPMLEAIGRHPREIFWFAHCDGFGGDIDEVYRAGPWRDRFLQEYGSHAGNAGIWGGWRDVLTREQAIDLAREAQGLGAEFVYPGQAFLNYCLDRLRAPVHNLHELGIDTIMWAGVTGCRVSGGQLFDANGGPVGMVHWAGYELRRDLPYRKLWDYWAAGAR